MAFKLNPIIGKPDIILALGDEIPSATQGSVLFVGASGILAQDNANLYWDDTNNRLGIGTNLPASPLSILSVPVANRDIGPAALTLSDGTIVRLYAVYDSGATRLRVNAPNGTAYGNFEISNGAFNLSSNSSLSLLGSSSNNLQLASGTILFNTPTNAGGDLRATITSSGNFGINTPTPSRKLEVLDASNPQLRLTQAAGVTYVDLQATSTGHLTVNPSVMNITKQNAALRVNAYTINTDSAEIRIAGGNTQGSLKYWWTEQDKEMVRILGKRSGSTNGVCEWYVRTNDTIPVNPFFSVIGSASVTGEVSITFGSANGVSSAKTKYYNKLFGAVITAATFANVQTGIGTGSQFSFATLDSNGDEAEIAGIAAVMTANTTTTVTGHLVFKTTDAAITPTERMRLDNQGFLGLNTTGADRRLEVLDTSNPQARLTYTDGSVYTDLQTNSSGNFIMTPTGGKALVGSDHVVVAANATKTTAGAPYTNDGYIMVTINGTSVKLMTTA